MNNAQFYLLCKQMEKDREVLLHERLSLRNAARYYSRIMEFTVSEKQIANAKEATGINWPTSRKAEPGQKSHYYRSNRALAVIVSRLFDELGLDKPKELIALCNGRFHAEVCTENKE